MKYRKLGRTDIDVSELCLGSMTWGTQNSEAEGHAQIDYAMEHGINFIDTAEMYPVNPISADTQGRTEEIIGTWWAGQPGKTRTGPSWRPKSREKAPNGCAPAARSMRRAFSRRLTAVCGGSRRTISIYINCIGPIAARTISASRGPSTRHRRTARRRARIFLSVLQCLGELVTAGKVRHVGLSNESCWGTSQFLDIAEAHGLPRVVSIQNEYSLMQRIYDLDLAELSHNEDVGLLAFSPQAAGFLSGKYQDGSVPAGSRRTFSDNLGGRYNDFTVGVVGEYLQVAARHGLDPCQMALAFCLTRPFMTSAIFGATTMEQLRNNVAAAEVRLEEGVLDDIQKVYRRYPVPM